LAGSLGDAPVNGKTTGAPAARPRWRLNLRAQIPIAVDVALDVPVCSSRLVSG